MFRSSSIDRSLSPLASVCVTVCLFFSTQIQAQQNVQVRSEDGNLWIQANNAPASEIAAQITQSLGINVIVTGDTETRINLDIVEEPMDKALAKLSPSNMLVRNGNSADSDIVEVILMMGESSGSAAGGSSSQFLPSGSPAEPVVVQEQETLIQEDALEDQERARIVREAAAAAANDPNLPPDQVPPMYAEDQPISGGLVIDPATGLPIEETQAQ